MTSLRERGRAVGVDIPAWIESAESDADDSAQGFEEEGENLDTVGREAGTTMGALFEDELMGLGGIAAVAVGAGVEYVFTQVGDEFEEVGSRTRRYADDIGDTTSELETALSELESAHQGYEDLQTKIDELAGIPEDERDEDEWLAAIDAARWTGRAVGHAKSRVAEVVDEAETYDRFHGENISAIESDIADSVDRLGRAFGALEKVGADPNAALREFTVLYFGALLDGRTMPVDETEDLDEIADRTGVDPVDILQGIEELQEAGLAEEDPDYFYIEWVAWTLANGLTPSELVDRARQEGVDADTFDVVDGLTVVRDPQARPYLVIEDAGDAREIVRLNELLFGGAPSENDDRRDENSWSFDEDVYLVLHTGGALIATPEGILMGIGGNPIVDWFSAKGGTTWGEIFMLNGDPDDPVQELIDIIESGSTHSDGDPTLDRLLHHERIHSEQWARYGYLDFIARYLDASTDVELHTRWVPWPIPFGSWVSYPVIVERDPCLNEYEQEAGLDDGGYDCD
ncbi:MAG: hypothetical protein GEU79_06410 [Acidimicrobiia bacterium]|nr:hypothetical protein [Acidimicrobiia bacterium]